MAESTTVQLNLRIESTLKDAAEREAAAQGQSLTEFFSRSLRSAIHPTCATCGRSSSGGNMANGFSDEFKKFRTKAIKEGGAVSLFTLEEGMLTVHWGKFDMREMPDEEGAVLFRVATSTQTLPGGWSGAIIDGEVTVHILRGLIVGWIYDQDGSGYQQKLILGYENGNAGPQRIYHAQRQAYLAQVGHQPPGRRPGGGRSR